MRIAFAAEVPSNRTGGMSKQIHSVADALRDLGLPMDTLWSDDVVLHIHARQLRRFEFPTKLARLHGCPCSKEMKVILIADNVPPAHDNIGAYACHLAAALRRRGCQVKVWTMRSQRTEAFLASGPSFDQSRSGISRMYYVVRTLAGHRDCTVVWQYNPFSYGWKGLPSLIHLLPLALKVFVGCRVAIVFHEICYMPGRDPRSWVWALCQRVALWVSLLGCDVAIATTRARQGFLERFACRFLPRTANRLVYVTVPVGSNIPAQPQPGTRRSPSSLVRIGTFRMGLTAQEIVSLQRLYHRLDQTGLCIQLQLVGDGSTAGLGRQYHEDDDQPGIIETGYLPADAVASVLRRLDVFIGLYDDGASGRRTSLAAAFAHGLCIVSTDGPNTDHALFRHGENCLLVPYGDNSCLHTALLTLIGDPDLREQLGRCAYETYRQEMAWPVIAGKIMEAIGES